jgi:Cu(I)/Ag(I) efflux system membrane fusion protein
MNAVRALIKPLLVALVASLAVACSTEPEPTAPAVERKTTRYVCPMHPHVVQDHPGECPICGMDLVPAEPQAAPAGGEAPRVAISAALGQALGLRTAPVERGKLWRRIDTVGFVEYAADEVTRVRPRVMGWVRAVDVTAPGTAVRKGARLFTLYSPELVAAQQEYLAVRASGDAALEAAGHARLGSLGLPAEAIERLAAGGAVQETIGVHAPRAGVVADVAVTPGLYVTPETEAFTLSDRSQLWVTAEVFPAQAAWLREGAPAEVRDPARPGAAPIETRIERVAGSVDPMTRAVRVRLPLPPDAARALRAEMYVDVTLFGGARDGVLSVPRDAVIRTGAGARVVVALGGGQFQPRAVEVGMESGDRVEVLSGLEEGESVVVSAQFLIDSESSLEAGLRSLDAGGDAPAADPHAGH